MASQKIGSLEGLRGVAAATVVLGHSLFVIFPYLGSLARPYPDPVPKTLVDAFIVNPPFTFFYAADAAVMIFFVLSGFVLTRAFFNSGDTASLQNGAARRYIRLVVPAFCSVLFAWALVHFNLIQAHKVGYYNLAGWPNDLYKDQVKFWAAIRMALFDGPFFGIVSLNGPLWTLQVELIGSMLLFACLSMGGRRHLVVACVWFLFFTDVLSARSPAALYYVAMLTGALLNLASLWLGARPKISTVIFCLGLGLITVDHSAYFAWLLQWGLPSLVPLGPDFNVNKILFWQFIASNAMVAGVIGSPMISRFFAHPIPTYLGRVSFSAYLLHFPLVMSLMIGAIGFAQRLGAGFLVSITFGMACFLLVLFPLADVFSRQIDARAMRWAARWASKPTGKPEDKLIFAPRP